MATDISSSGFPKNRVNSRAPRCCVRCRNHGLKKLVRGHKRYCPYTMCPCRLCLATKERQVHMAKTIKKRRYFLQDLAMQVNDPKLAKQPEPIPSLPIYKPPEVTTFPQGPPVPGPVEPPRDTPPTSPVGSLPPPSYQNAASVKSEASLPTSSPYSTPIDDSLWESSIGSKIRALISTFNFKKDVDIYSLLYVILRYSSSDVEEVYNRIVEEVENTQIFRSHRAHRVSFTSLSTRWLSPNYHGRRVICVEPELSQQSRYAHFPTSASAAAILGNYTSAIGACTLLPIAPAALLRNGDKQSLPIPCPESERSLGWPDFWEVFTKLPTKPTLDDVTSLHRAPSR